MKRLLFAAAIDRESGALLDDPAFVPLDDPRVLGAGPAPVPGRTAGHRYTVIATGLVGDDGPEALVVTDGSSSLRCRPGNMNTSAAFAISWGSACAVFTSR